MCANDWSKKRAVLFLDPYGAQAHWRTIEVIAKTKAIDLWVLFPLGAVNRMLTHSGEIPQEWRDCLDDLLGNSDWYERFYQMETSSTLFEERVERVVKATTQASFLSMKT